MKMPPWFILRKYCYYGDVAKAVALSLWGGELVRRAWSVLDADGWIEPHPTPLARQDILGIFFKHSY